jgi:hypothetical protein
VAISPLPVAAALLLAGQAPALAADPAAAALAYVYREGQRSGGGEPAFTGATQGLAPPERNTKRFAAQPVLVALRQLAHHVLSWARRLLAVHAPRVRDFGRKRLVRDACGVSGGVACAAADQVRAVVLTQAAPRAPHLLAALRAPAAATASPIRRGET